ncbi:MAG: S-layer homology domain-containing protein [Firmicutes bacterium]|nr:S-layer homology domain-containing protein [Bacillota bacterium]
MIAGTVAPALAKSPFADVPADHWAYDAIVELAAAGLIEGYPDGTYGGSRMMTRYEAAMVFARALARLEGKIAETDVLAELDLIKAELMDEIKAELEALDVPVETKVLEKVIVEKELDEEALARVKAVEKNLEMLGGDIAYVEHRMIGLVDGIRYDLDKLQEGFDGLSDAVAEQPSLEEIEELIAAKLEEGILEAALSAKEVVKETVVVEKVVEEIEVDGLTEEDVEAIAEALIAGQLQKYDLLLDETREHLYAIYTRLDDVEAAQAEAAAAIKELEKVRLGGKLDFDSSNKEDEFEHTQSVALDLYLKPADGVNVKAFLKGGVNPADGKLSGLSFYGAEVTSESLIKRFVAGYKAVQNSEISSRFSGYALSVGGARGTDYAYLGLADLDLFKNFSGNVFVGSKDAGASSDVEMALALKYELIPELGLKATVAGRKGSANALPEAEGVYAGIFGDLLGVTYGGDFALDLRAEEDNMLFGGSLDAEFLDFLTLKGKYITAQDNYDIGRPFVADDVSSLMELGAGVDFLGIEVDGGYYREFADFEDAVIQAYRFGAGAEFDLFVPVEISAEYVSNEREEQKTHAEVKVGVSQEPDLGFRYGADFALILGEYAKNGNWKNGGITDQDVNIIGANVGYKTGLRGAVLDLGYGASFRMPVKPEGDNVLTHEVDLGYNFTDDVKLSLGGSLKHKLEEDYEFDWEYSAGLGISF